MPILLQIAEAAVKSFMCTREAAVRSSTCAEDRRRSSSGGRSAPAEECNRTINALRFSSMRVSIRFVARRRNADRTPLRHRHAAQQPAAVGPGQCARDERIEIRA